ncbi:tautomerase family protein [Halalkalibacter sp. APA_J-10(15)]|uniref:tautomerase family protein n=1 Tax=unclassified Halalkalibacter TaxID=2893063 RepID=UPI001FF1D75B|nr:tautomerase family protein [Halalkalibacter sp. APA_J-10(15)]MCK0472241.1 tautomerase family protein [Halalkalibacter sp. APA_J-10(15)]
MGQVKVFGLKDVLNSRKKLVSSIIHSCMVDALEFPEEKKFQRFFLMDEEDFFFSNDRSENYMVIEISMFEGRSIATKKKLIQLLYERLTSKCKMRKEDIELTIFETPKHHWGIRGLPGDELALNYNVDL